MKFFGEELSAGVFSYHWDVSVGVEAREESGSPMYQRIQVKAKTCANYGKMTHCIACALPYNVKKAT